MTKRSFSAFLYLLTTLAALAADPMAKGTAQEREKPRLVLQITVDALRGDLPWRYIDRLGFILTSL